MTDPLRRFSPWFYAAAAYNLTWGATNVLAPSLLARPLGLDPHGLVAWQGLGMLVLVYAPGYWWAARRPSQHAHLIAIALLGKTLGPIGFAWAAATGKLPLHFGLTILTNDLLWLPPFARYLHAATRACGGLTALLTGGSSNTRQPPQTAMTPPQVVERTGCRTAAVGCHAPTAPPRPATRRARRARARRPPRR
jgi:hypothetical protein